MKAFLKSVSGTLSNFAAISLGIAIYQYDPLGFVLGAYSLFLAGIIAWRAKMAWTMGFIVVTLIGGIAIALSFRLN